MDTRIRSITKSITWRVVAVVNGFLVAYVYLGSIKQSVLIAVVGNITGFVLYYMHERIWNLFGWRQKK